MRLLLLHLLAPALLLLLRLLLATRLLLLGLLLLLLNLLSPGLLLLRVLALPLRLFLLALLGLGCLLLLLHLLAPCLLLLRLLLALLVLRGLLLLHLLSAGLLLRVLPLTQCLLLLGLLLAACLLLLVLALPQRLSLLRLLLAARLFLLSLLLLALLVLGCLLRLLLPPRLFLLRLLLFAQLVLGHLLLHQRLLLLGACLLLLLLLLLLLCGLPCRHTRWRPVAIATVVVVVDVAHVVDDRGRARDVRAVVVDDCRPVSGRRRCGTVAPARCAPVHVPRIPAPAVALQRRADDHAAAKGEGADGGHLAAAVAGLGWWGWRCIGIAGVDGHGHVVHHLRVVARHVHHVGLHRLDGDELFGRLDHHGARVRGLHVGRGRVVGRRRGARHA